MHQTTTNLFWPSTPHTRIHTHRSKRERSLDVICNNHSDFEMWYWGIQVVRSYPPSKFHAFLAQRSEDQLRKSFPVVGASE